MNTLPPLEYGHSYPLVTVENSPIIIQNRNVKPTRETERQRVRAV
jgi:hypothetical protein